jgi:hypothetical protein
MKRYKIAYYYQDWESKDSEKIYAHHDDALFDAMLERAKLDSVFAIIIYRHGSYLDYFLNNIGISILEFFKNFGWCFIAIEGHQPVAMTLMELTQEEIDIVRKPFEGIEIFRSQIVMAFTGALSRDQIYGLTLHEAGHIVTDMKTKLSYDNYILYHELKAWEWADEQAMRLNLNMTAIRRLVMQCLGRGYILEHQTDGKLKGAGMTDKIYWKHYHRLVDFKKEDLNIT